MTRATRIRRLITAFAIILMISGCATYKSREVSFRHPSAFANMQYVSGAQVAVESHADPKQAKEVFGFDIRATGILPVQVVIDNTGDQELQIVTSQTFLIDGQGNMWNLLQGSVAYERMEKSTEYARIVKGGGKGAIFGAASGALIGAAIGVLTGENVGTALAKGAAIGGAGGATIGGIQGGLSEDAGRQISRDLANKELQNKVIGAGSMAHGFLFFPGEAPSAKSLRLQLEEVRTGQRHTLLFDLP
ncbi:MAG: hypothetical protein GX751_06060 [Desulfuromonadaceae bacterium]|nr:hypothetical protein [Desulfuromonadaceae bacterium]